MNAVLLDRRRFGWDVTVSASHNDNKWVDLGKDPAKCVLHGRTAIRTARTS